MKRKDIWLYTLVMAACSVLTVNIVTKTLLNRSLVSVPSIFKNAPQATVSKNFVCGTKPQLKDLDASGNKYLGKLAEYQQICNSFVTDQLMVFTDMPKDDPSAKKAAAEMAKLLKEFSKYNVHPIVVAEPVTEWGDIDFTEFSTGLYDASNLAYFTYLKKEGVTDAQMGTWLPFPEANLPYWNRSQAKPEDFPKIINRYLGAARSVFPGMKTTVLLNSSTYDATDFDFARGEYSSLIPWVKGMDKKLVDSFGLQGFPWLPPADRIGPGITDAGEFLNFNLAKEAADAIGTKNIWYNTGVFARRYVGNPAKEVSFSTEQRSDILNGIIAQAEKTKTQGYSVSINLFAEDKGNTAEGTDWSFFNSSSVLTSPGSPVFANFAARLHQSDINLSLYDVRR